MASRAAEAVAAVRAAALRITAAAELLAEWAAAVELEVAEVARELARPLAAVPLGFLLVAALPLPLTNAISIRAVAAMAEQEELVAFRAKVELEELVEQPQYFVAGKGELVGVAE